MNSKLYSNSDLVNALHSLHEIRREYEDSVQGSDIEVSDSCEERIFTFYKRWTFLNRIKQKIISFVAALLTASLVGGTAVYANPELVHSVISWLKDSTAQHIGFEIQHSSDNSIVLKEITPQLSTLPQNYTLDESQDVSGGRIIQLKRDDGMPLYILIKSLSRVDYAGMDSMMPTEIEHGNYKQYTYDFMFGDEISKDNGMIAFDIHKNVMIIINSEEPIDFFYEVLDLLCYE